MPITPMSAFTASPVSSATLSAALSGSMQTAESRRRSDGRWCHADTASAMGGRCSRSHRRIQRPPDQERENQLARRAAPCGVWTRCLADDPTPYSRQRNGTAQRARFPTPMRYGASGDATQRIGIMSMSDQIFLREAREAIESIVSEMGVAATSPIVPINQNVRANCVLARDDFRRTRLSRSRLLFYRSIFPKSGVHFSDLALAV